MTRSPDPDTLDGRELVERVTADSEKAELGLRRGNLLVTVVGIVFVLAVASGAVLFNRIYPPPSPPNTATQDELTDLRADLDQYLAGRGGLRDQQYAKTVYTLCELAADTGNAQVFADYDCPAVLAAPSPTISDTPPVTPMPSATSTPASAPSPSVQSTAANPGAGARPPPTSVAPSSPTPTAAAPTRTTRPSPSASAAPTPLLSTVLCTLPILTLCPGGTP